MKTVLKSAVLGLAASAASFALPAWAERIAVDPADRIQEALDLAAEGDVVVLKRGEHSGTIRIARRMTVEGEPGAVLLGNGKGSVVTVSAPSGALLPLGDDAGAPRDAGDPGRDRAVHAAGAGGAT